MKKGFLLIFLFVVVTQLIITQKWSAPGGIREKPLDELLRSVSVVGTETDTDIVSTGKDRFNLSADAGRKSWSGAVTSISGKFRIK